MTSAEVENRILHLERQETATLSINSAALLIIHSLIFFFYGFGLEKGLVVARACSVIAVISLIYRIIVSKKIKDGSDETSSRYWFRYKLAMWIYAGCFSGVFHAVSAEHGFASPHFVVMVALTISYSVSILHTTSYDKSIYVPMQFFFLTPHLTAYLLEVKEPNHSTYAIILLFFLVNHVLYILSQFKLVNQKRYEKFRTQVDLEISNIKLQQSQKELLTQTQNAVYASKLVALGEMAAGMSHEINNPLMIIRGNLEFLQRILEKESKSSPQIDILFAKSKKAVDRIVYIIKGLKDFSRQERHIAKEPVHLSNIIDETSVFCFEMLKAHNIQLIIDDVPDIKIACKPLQITQVLFNLIKNADDAFQNSIDDSEKWVRISFEVSRVNVFIHVSNGGPKVIQEHQDKLFHPFFTTKEPGKGLGMALSISMGIIQEHSGDIIYNRHAEVTTFTIKLPIATIEA